MGTKQSSRQERFPATRMPAAAWLAGVALLFSSSAIYEVNAAVNVVPTMVEQQHAFDFLHGTWRVHHHRLKARLAHSDEWDDFDGTTRCWAMLGGEGNVDDNVIALPLGIYRAATMRIFDSKARLWRIWWFDARNPGALDPPLVGSFQDGVGAFYADDLFQGKPIRVRFLWKISGTTSARWEQAFSDDGGKTWETNWVMSFERQST